MKKFKFFFNIYIKLSLIFTTLITLTALGFNIFMIIDTPPFDSQVKYIILGALCVLLSACVLSVLFNSKYSVKDSKLYLTFGFVFTSYPIAKIVQLGILEEGKSLVCYFEDATFTKIVIKKEFFEQFIQTIKEQNDKIIAQTSSLK